jgi:L,D-peptidoglycan transpeptidase YkuD (ErfK/YbiS/YcfS/YnhG family)
VCDADSIYFNTWQERDDPTLTESWNHKDVEHLEDYDVTYRYSVVIRYNTPPYVIPDRGSAIFLHCFGPTKPYTGGCVALPENIMKLVMQNVREDCVVVIDTLENLNGTL